MIIGTLQQVFEDMERGVYDFTKDGKCSGCGQCCSVYLPLSSVEIKEIRRYIQVDKNHLPYQLEEQKFKTIADHYGFIKQSMMMIEECSELQKAICKWHRKRGDSLRLESSDCDERTAIIDELADVIIMAKQITYLLSAEDEVSEQIEFKLDRQLRRMEEENAD